MPQPADIAADLACRIEALRGFERQYRAELRVYLTGKLGEIGGSTNTVVLSDVLLHQAERARQLVVAFEGQEGERTRWECLLAAQVWGLLGILDEITGQGGNGV